MNNKRITKLVLLSILSITTGQLWAQTIALKNVNVIDVEQLKVTTKQTIIIENDLIQKVQSAKKRIPKSAIVVDMKGKYVMPGLIDAHVHHATAPDDWDNDDITRKRLRGLLRGGVTGVRDMGGDNRALASLKRRADNDVIQSPDIYYSVIIGGKQFFSDPRTVASAKGETPGEVDWMRAVDENSNFEEIMLRAKGTGATGIKIYASVPAKLIPKLERSAKQAGLKVWSHVYVGPARPKALAEAGVEVLSHTPDIASHVVGSFYETRRKGGKLSEEQIAESLNKTKYQDLFNTLKQQDTILDPTLTVFLLKPRGKNGPLLKKWGAMFTQMAHEKGIRIAAGTDGASDMYNQDYPLVHNEMKLLVEKAGMSPFEAIRSATLINAQVIGIEQQVGTIAQGKKANLVVLNQSPEQDIDNTRDIAHVIKNGQFVYRGKDKKLPFVPAKKAAGMLWMSGQIGNLPGTMQLAGDSIEAQMKQAMENMGQVLQEHDLGYNDITKCTLMLADIDNWSAANKVYLTYFQTPPARSAFGASGLALGAQVEIECIAEL